MDRIELVHCDTLSCEAIVRRAPNGELILVCQCGGTGEPMPENRVYVFHSADEGSTWTKPQLIVPDNGRAVYATEVAVAEGEIIVFLTEHDGRFTDWRSYAVSSFDGGYTFTKKCDMAQLSGFCFARGMIRAGGRYVLTYQRYPVSRERDKELRAEHKFIWESGVDFVESGTFSTVDFMNFQPSERAARLPLRFSDGRPKWVWSEPTIAPLPDGRLVMLLRFDARNYLYRSESSDCGKTWSEPVPTDIPNPGNKPKLIPLSDGRIALLHTPQTGWQYIRRQPLSLWISDDGMQSWGYRRDVVTFPGWLSYPDGFQSEDGKRILFSFELNRHDVYFVDAEI